MGKKAIYTSAQKTQVVELSKQGLTAEAIEKQINVNRGSQSYIKQRYHLSYSRFKEAVTTEIIENDLKEEEKARILELQSQLNTSGNQKAQLIQPLRELKQIRKRIRKLASIHALENKFIELIPENKMESKKRRIIGIIVEDVILRVEKIPIQSNLKPHSPPMNYFSPEQEASWFDLIPASPLIMKKDVEGLYDIKLEDMIPTDKYEGNEFNLAKNQNTSAYSNDYSVNQEIVVSTHKRKLSFHEK